MEIEHAAGPGHLRPALQGSAGTASSLLLRTVQCVAAVMSLVAMVPAAHFATVPSFIFLLVAAGVQSLWSFALAILDLDFILISKDASKKDHWFLHILKYGDTVVGAVIFCAASAASGVLVFIRYDIKSCPSEDCHNFEVAITRAFISFAAIMPCALANWSEAAITWGTWPASDEDAKSSLTDFIIILLNMFGVLFAAPSIGIGLMMSCQDPATDVMCIPSTPLEFLIIALITQVSATVVEVGAQLIAMGCGATTLTGPPLTCLMFVAGRWVMSLWSLGTACATLGLMHFYYFNAHVFDKSTNMYDAFFCGMSLAASVFSAMSSSLRAYVVVSCWLRRGRSGAAQQQAGV